METTMSIRGRVGRHTNARGKQCQNWENDQRTVIDLLNRIPVTDGGAGGSLAGRVIPGVASDALYDAIKRFEEKYFLGQHNGFVDPGGAILRRMEQLAARPASKAAAEAPPKAAAETPLDILRRNVLNVDILKGKWTAGDRVEMDKLAAMAVDHIDRLKRGDGVGLIRSEPLDKLPWWAELFGRAYVTRAETELTGTRSPLFPSLSNQKPYMYARDGHGNKHEVSAEMKYGSPLTWTDAISTWTLPGLILFQDGLCAFVRSNAQVGVAEAHEMVKQGQIW
jgi:hypothetical protein